MIRTATNEDYPAIAEIYNHYVVHTTATCETTRLSHGEIQKRAEEAERLDLPWLIAENNTKGIDGFACARRWKERAAYLHTVEISVYLAPQCKGQGLGTALYNALFRLLRNNHVHAAIAGITLPNHAGVALHEKFAMKKVAYLKEVCIKFGTPLDLGYWQIVLNRNT